MHTRNNSGCAKFIVPIQVLLRKFWFRHARETGFGGKRASARWLHPGIHTCDRQQEESLGLRTEPESDGYGRCGAEYEPVMFRLAVDIETPVGLF